MGCAASTAKVQAPLQKQAQARERRPERQHLSWRDGRAAPASLRELAVRCVCEQLERWPQLKLPAELAAAVSEYMIARGWFSCDAIRRLEASQLFELDLAAGPAKANDSCLHALRAHRSLVSLDLTGSRRLTDEGIDALATLTGLRSLCLTGCVAVGDAGLLRLKPLESLELLLLERLPLPTERGVVAFAEARLHTLSLAGCPRVGAAALAALQPVAESLQRLSLAKCDALDSGAMPHLLGFVNLESLDLSWCRSLSGAALTQLERLPCLRELQLGNTSLDDGCLRALGRLPKLQELGLRGCQVGDAGVAHCAALRRLSWLSLRACAVTDRGLDALLQLTKLKALDLAFTEVSDNGVLKIAGALHSLTELNLESCRLSAASVGALRQLPQLRTLNLADTEIATDETAGIGALVQLESLNLFYSGLSNDGVSAALGNLSSLTELTLDGRLIGDAALPAVSKLRSLTSLDLFGARVSDRGMQLLTRLTSLRRLELCGGMLSNAGLALLPALPKLRRLNVAQNPAVSDAGLAYLLELPWLDSLNLSFTKVSGHAMPLLRQLTSLTSLGLHGCALRANHATQLRVALPLLIHLGVDFAERQQ